MKSTLKLFSLLVFFLGSSFAQTTSDVVKLTNLGINSGARALGMGNAYTSLSDDGSGALFNPAGLGFVKRMEIMGGLKTNSFSNNTTFFNNTLNSSVNSTQLDNISFVFPMFVQRGSLVFGFAYNTTQDYNSSMKFDGYNGGATSWIQQFSGGNIPYQLYLTDDNHNTLINGKLNQSGNNNQSGTMHDWNFSAAIEASKDLMIGASLHFLSGDLNWKRNYYEDDNAGNYSGVTLAPGYSFSSQFKSFELSQELKWEMSGYDFRFGGIYQIKNRGRIGASIEFPKSYTIKETFTVDAKSVFATIIKTLPNPENYQDKVEYDVTTPFVFHVGGAVNFKGLILSGELAYTDYTQTKYSNPVRLDESYISDINSAIKDNMRSVVNYNIGAEYTIADLGLRVRAGYFIQRSPYAGDDDSFAKKYSTFGVGYLVDESVSIDLAYAHGTWKDLGDNYGSKVSRTFSELSANTFIATVSYRL